MDPLALPLQFPLLAALLVGLFSVVHCLGMCGGIMGALTFSVPPPVRHNRPWMMVYLLAYNMGRIASYAVAGAVVGGAGDELLGRLAPEHGLLLLQLFAAVMLAAIGFYLAGWFPRFALLERLGEPLWRRLEPIGRRMLPVRSPAWALLYGAIWGWLPCGLVYSVLIWTAGAGGALQGAATMAAFGVGTLPAVVGAGMIAGTLGRLTRQPWVRRTAGILLILFAIAGPAHSLLGGGGAH